MTARFVCMYVYVFLNATSTARLWSDMETLVLRCQHTCMVVLARWWLCLSREQRDEFTSSSDSCSKDTSSDDPARACREKREEERSGEEGRESDWEGRGLYLMQARW